MGEDSSKADLPVTAEMIEAGLDVYAECNPDLMCPSEIVRRIYLEMAQIAASALTQAPASKGD